MKPRRMLSRHALDQCALHVLIDAIRVGIARLMHERRLGKLQDKS